MNDSTPSSPAVQHGTLLDDDALLDLAAFGRACRLTVVQVETWVAEGVVVPRGGSPDGAREAWRFDGAAIRRVRDAHRLQRDLEVNPPGVALALELMDEIAALQSRLRRR